MFNFEKNLISFITNYSLNKIIHKMATEKKITRVESTNKSDTSTNTNQTWAPTAENKGKATQLRVIAVVAWLLAIAAQLFAIWHILHTTPIKMWLVIVLIVVDLAFAIVGSVLWKKSNRLDPASEKNKLMFFLQSQLGLFTAIIAFLPLVIVIFTSKNLDGKQKGILGGIAVVGLLVAGFMGIDFNPPSIEQYTQESKRVEELMGKDYVYWTKSGKKYHLYKDCQHLKGDRTTEIFEGGSVADAYANNSKIKPNAESLCKTCENRAVKEKGNSSEPIEDTTDKIKDVAEGIVNK